jgi:hypothetical protein
MSREALDALLAKEMQAQIEREDQQAANYQQMVQDSRVVENEARAKRVQQQQKEVAPLKKQAVNNPFL